MQEARPPRLPVPWLRRALPAKYGEQTFLVLQSGRLLAVLDEFLFSLIVSVWYFCAGSLVIRRCSARFLLLQILKVLDRLVNIINIFYVEWDLWLENGVVIVLLLLLFLHFILHLLLILVLHLYEVEDQCHDEAVEEVVECEEEDYQISHRQENAIAFIVLEEFDGRVDPPHNREDLCEDLVYEWKWEYELDPECVDLELCGEDVYEEVAEAPEVK